MASSVDDPILRIANNGAVAVNQRFFFSEKLLAYEGHQVQVTFDESDGDDKVWVGDMDGNVIDCAHWMNMAEFAEYLLPNL